MYAILTHVRFKSGQTESARKAAEEHLLPVLKTLPGFLRYYAVQTGENTAVTISAWQSRQDAEGGLPRVAQVVQEAAGQYIENLEREQGEVVLQEPVGS